MRSYFLAFPALAMLLVACGDGEPHAADSATSAPPGAVASSAIGAATGAAAAPDAPSTTSSSAPITGVILEVKMIGDAKGYRFEPAQLLAAPGDGVKFVVTSGAPHEVSFDLDAVPPESRLQLMANMPNGSDGHSPLLAVPNETWTLSLGGLKPGKYPFVSTPRLPQGMRGEIEIQ